MKTVLTVTSEDIKAIRSSRRAIKDTRTTIGTKSIGVMGFLESKIPVLKKKAKKGNLKKSGKRIVTIKLLNQKEVNESWTRILNRNTGL